MDIPTLWTMPVLAIFWLLVASMWQKLGFKSKMGLKVFVLGALWLVFYNTFEIINTVFPNTYWNYGLQLGGALAWILGLIGALWMMYEALSK
ncbi:MAG TPA: hypothetical protein ENG01_00955 [Candidatus Aenigmarchaeota archaeon]|nr:MAG: hypothetical protein DRN75_02790 [Nanoarchaeota archaeon]HDO79912.1 hypothetical protein [Candidatus Aenigmarchaeota archaeon]HEX32964.1 hypothetical protein [Candidatus Aenigmarchaeota archaeon]